MTRFSSLGVTWTTFVARLIQYLFGHISQKFPLVESFTRDKKVEIIIFFQLISNELTLHFKKNITQIQLPSLEDKGMTSFLRRLH